MSTVASAGGPGGPPPGAGDRGLARAGRAFVGHLYGAMRALRLYPVENQVVQTALADLHESASDLLEREGAIVLRLVGETFFLNDLTLRADLATFAVFRGVSQVLKAHGVAVVEVDGGIRAGEWTAVLSVLLREPAEADPFDAVTAALERSAAGHIHFGDEREYRGGATGKEGKEAAKRTYAQSVAVAREVMGGARIGQGVSLRKVKRSVQSIVDQVLSNETSIVGMTNLRDYDEYTFTHCVNVCIFSVALGKKLGFQKHHLYELGMGALLHDVGKVSMPLEVLNKPGALDPEEWALMKEHPTEGLLALFRMQGFSEPPLRTMLMVYEHHMKTDLSGYPTSVRARQPTLFPRIVAVADAFDAATSKRSYQSEPWPPDQVLREMWENPDRGFDRLVVKAFISMTGIYPVGTLVILDTYELGVVLESNPDPAAAHQPIIQLAYDSLGMPKDPPEQVDLSETDPETGKPIRTIVKTTDPERYGIDVADYFV